MKRGWDGFWIMCALLSLGWCSPHDSPRKESLVVAAIDYLRDRSHPLLPEPPAKSDKTESVSREGGETP